MSDTNAGSLRESINTLLEMAESARLSGDLDMAEECRGMARDILDYLCWMEQQS